MSDPRPVPRAAAEARVAALIAAAARRRAAADARRARQQLARRHGLTTRHATKLARLQQPHDDNNQNPEEATNDRP